MDQSKKFKHNKIEVCKISKEPIDTTKDNYVILVDCFGKEVTSTGFYKLEYLKDLMKGKGEVITDKLMQRTGNLASSMLEKMGVLKPVYEIKNA